MTKYPRHTPPELDEPASEQRVVGNPVGKKLRYREVLVTLRTGKLYLGRSPTCELAISDPAVSRRHARLWVTETKVVIEDLGSQNGVYVSGTRIHGPCDLKAGDIIRICGHELELVDVALEPPSDPEANRYRITADSFTDAERPTLVEELHSATNHPPAGQHSGLRVENAAARISSRPPESDSLAKAVVTLDRVLHLGDWEEAGRRLRPILMRVHQLVLEGHPHSLELAEHVSILAARFAGEARDATFMSFAVMLYQLLNRPLPEPAVNVIHLLIQQGRYPDVAALTEYVVHIAAGRERFDETELFLLDRLRRIVVLA